MKNVGTAWYHFYAVPISIHSKANSAFCELKGWLLIQLNIELIRFAVDTIMLATICIFVSLRSYLQPQGDIAFLV